MTGPPRPFFSLVKARRKMLTTSLARMIGSDDFANGFIASLELKFGSICASLR
ncbi:hypothetical protein GA0061099_1001105 [Bradyrhizobium yuanmingense]|uniref:Uncharacterized protein n=1 Tax=Bradyrhizobium yuanmingense TaxID=108015 RepID=A0A1C3TWF3_9BRAD|nr:hypothetical protein IQ15_01655 [Bradyrhizobium yuanmingense]SCB07432.1 hypothetical protein GA0061099_1001105 [Bradyrhizobium yuanmingense]